MRLTVVGGGSTYTPELVDGVLRRRDRLPITEIVLVDPDAERLEVVGAFARRMCARAGSDLTVEWGADLAGGVQGAAFVVSQIRVGGQVARDADERLGRELGLVGQETVGIGGFANALRTVPAALEIADAVAAHAPDALLLGFTNPAGLVTEALTRHHHVPTIGLCNVPWSVRAGIARGLGVDAQAVDIESVGLNHLSWIRRITVADEDRTEPVLDGLVARAQRAVDRGERPEWHPGTLRMLRALPNPYLRYFYDTPSILEHQRQHPTRASEVLAIEAALLDRYRDPELTEKPPELDQRGGAHYSEAAAALMADVWTDAGTVHVIDVPNRGAIPDLPDDVVVEVAASVHRAGVVPRPVSTPLRGDVAALIRQVKEFELLTVEAAVHADEDLAREALAAHPLGPPAGAVAAAWQRVRAVHRGRLGRFDD